jgi:restriction endonuclease S subunit
MNPSHSASKDNWKKVKFSEIAEEIREVIDKPSKSGFDRFVGGDHIDSGDLHIKRWGSTNDVNAQKLLFKKGHILFGKRNAYLRKVAYADFDGVCSAHMMVLKPKTEKIEESFFPHFMQTDQFWERASMISEGSMSPTIKWKILAEQEFVIPSLPDQRRIATTLWVAEDCIVKGELYVTAVERAKQVLMGELFSKGIGHSDFKKIQSIGQIPKKWNVTHLGDIADTASGATLGRKLIGKTISLPYLRVANVQDGYIDLTEIKEIEILESEKNKWLLKSGDILLTEGGDWDQLGRGGIWRDEIPDCIHQNHIFRLRITDSNTDVNYLHYLINSPFGKSFFLKCSKQTTNLASINQSQLKKFVVLQPPLPEQRQIAAILTRCDETIAAARASVMAGKALKMKMINEMLGAGN